MEIRTLKVEPRNISEHLKAKSLTGSKAAKIIRRGGSFPGVIYAKHTPATSIQLEDRSYHLAVRNCKPAQIFKLQSSAPELNGLNALIKDLQIEPLKGRVLHIDLVAIREDDKVTVEVPLELTGECQAVKEARAVLSQSEYEIEIECIPGLIPDKLSLDIANLKEGASLHADEVPLPDGVKLKSAPKLVIVVAISKKALDAEELAAAAANPAPVAPVAAPAAKSGTAKTAAPKAAAAAAPKAAAKPAAKK